MIDIIWGSRGVDAPACRSCIPRASAAAASFPLGSRADEGGNHTRDGLITFASHERCTSTTLPDPQPSSRARRGVQRMTRNSGGDVRVRRMLWALFWCRYGGRVHEVPHRE